MPISNYTQLQQAVSDWMARADVLGSAGDFIALGEAGLNRALNPVETEMTLYGRTGDRSINITVACAVRPIALFITDTCGEVELLQRAAGTYPIVGTTGKPAIWSIDGQSVVFNRNMDQDYTFRFRYQERFALSDAVPTNWLLQNHPDLYLAASLVWGGVFIQNGNYAASFKTVLDEMIPSVRNVIAQSKRGVLTVDPALLGRRCDDWRLGA